MKTPKLRRLAPAVLWLALTPCNAPAQAEPPPATAPAIPPPVSAKPPRFHASNTQLLPDTVIEVDFPMPVIPAEKVNTEHDLIKTDPPIPGKGIWTSRTTARFTFTDPPPLGTTVTFSLSAGHRYEDGKEIPAIELGKRATPPFQMLRSPRAGGSEREPAIVIVFNDAVSADQAGPFLFFSDGGTGRIPAKTGPLYYKDVDASLRWSLGQEDGARGTASWTDRWKIQAGAKPAEPGPDDIVPHALVVRPHLPLTPAEHWRIDVMAALPNAAGTAQLTKAAEAGWFRVEPLKITASSHTPAASERAVLHVNVSRALPKEGVDWKQWVSLDPAVNDLKITATGNTLILESPDIVYRRAWTVTLKTGTPSADGIAASSDLRTTVTPQPDSPDLSLPSWDTAQLAAGTRTYRIHTKNLKSARVRVKLLSSEDALRTLRAYASVKGNNDDRRGKPKAEELAVEGSLPWSIVPGKSVLDRTWTFEGRLDVSYPITLNWTELLGGQKSSGVLFVSTEGEPLASAVDSKEDGKRRLAQALVQLTDIGLAWKLNTAEALLYAFSLESGAPLSGTKFTLHDKDGADTATFTADEQGICRVPRNAGATLLTASRPGDQFTVAFDRTLPRETLWRFPVEVDWNPAKDFRRTVMMFTDRGIYRPGETVHMKGLVRKRLDTDLQLPDEREVQFTVLDSDEKPVIEKKVTLTENGTFSETITLPAMKVGRFTMRVEFPQPEKKKEEPRNGDSNYREGEFEDEYIYDGEIAGDFVFNESFRVEEFRRNTFEIEMAAPKVEPGSTAAEVSVSASYLMGQHLSDAQVRYYVNTQAAGFYPDGYREFLFGDHQGYDAGYWEYYYGWRDRHWDEDGVQRGADAQSGELTLGADGKLLVPVVIPKPEFPAPHEVSVSVEVTDVNQQTLSGSASFTVQPAGIHLGVARVDDLIHTGRETALQFIALANDEKPVTRALPVHVKIEQETYETVQVRTASGFTQTRSEPRRTVVKEEDITLPAGAGDKAVAFPYAFKPDKSGSYFVELRARDEAGRETATRSRFYCYGAGDYAWEYEQGARIRLVPEKKSWKPGETARILVMTPIDGTALVTLERANVVRAFTVKLSSTQPVLEIPLTDADAPNVYISVAVIKGLAENKRAVKEPVLKLGYCQLVVENTADDLNVAVTVPRPSYRPGANAEIIGSVLTQKGEPAAGAEVTLWAVDEGVLSVMGYENPDPQSVFMPLLPLSVRCGTSLDLYLPEDANQRWYVNKGFLIGGGGDEEGASAGRLRKNFNPLAFWQADVKTDAQGRYTVSFPVPDTLTRYRVLALAVKGARGFGLGTGALTVNKPLMLEPVVPRFASVGDALVPKAVVHNTSTWSGTFAVTLERGPESQFAGGDKERSSVMQQIELAAGETKSLTWNVQFTNYGDAAWRWRAEPLKLPAECKPQDRAEMVDYVESRFPVKYPGPLLSERRSVVLTQEKNTADLLAGFNPALMNRATRVELELSRSRFQECAEAMEYLLTYPYGCVEQTSSSTMPWLAVRDLKGIVPKLNRSEAEIARMIQAGADRLNSMRTDSGGLAYWQGGREPNLWGSCWGGLTMLRCRDAGAAVPQETVDKLAAWLSGEVRRLFAASSPENQQHAAAALCTLAWTGKAEPAYQTRLYEQRAGLSRGARAWLSLAIAKSGGPAAQCQDLLSLPPPADAKDPYDWFSHGEYAAALELFAWCHIAPQNPAVEIALNALTEKRGPHGHWHSTFNNAWGMNAFAAYATKVERSNADPAVTIGGLASEQFTLTAADPAKFFDLKPKAGMPVALAASVTAAAGSRLYATVKLTGQPELLPMREVSSGLAITRTYQRLTVEGKSEPLGEPRVGDLVLVSLRLQVPHNVHYIAVDDPLPCTFEAVNSDFKSQAAAGNAANSQKQVGWRDWISDHEELRDDRALFFCDYVYGDSNYEIRYLARVSGVGEATAAQAKIEAMYEPEKYGLSASERVKTLPRANGAKEVSENR